MNTFLLGLGLGLWLGTGTATLAQPVAEVSAEIVEIPEDPVFWGQPPAPEAAGRVGTRVEAGGYLRTEVPGKAQVQLPDGLIFRLGGDAILELTDTDLNLRQGQIIAWVRPGTEGSPRRIQTPLATAAIRGTTVFIDQEERGCRIFSWEGEVEVSLADGSDSVILNTGEEVLVAVGMTQLPDPAPLGRAAAQERFATSILLNGFESEMETLEIIQELLLSQPALPEPSSPDPS